MVIFLSLIFLIIIFIFLYLNYSNIIYVKSNNGSQYLIYKSKDRNNKAKHLANIIQNMYILRDYLYNNINNFPEYKEYIIQLYNNFNINRTTIYETDPKSSYTSYSVNKGEELSICLQDKISHELYDINLLMYVVIHEMAHFACPEIGHGELFINIFKKFLEEAIKIGIYVKNDYALNPVNYCGLLLNKSVI